MLDKKSLAVLKNLNKLSNGATYKVITGEDILSSIPQKTQYDLDNIKEIIDFLEKQGYINIKFSEENTYCYSLLPKARIYLEQESNKPKNKQANVSIMQYVYTMISSFVGTTLALLLIICVIF